MVINFITTQDILDIEEYMRWAYEEICDTNKKIISNLQSADKNFLYRSLIKAKRSTIDTMIEKSIDCVLSHKYSQDIIDIIQNKGFLEIEDIYPIKASFENGLINIYLEYKLYNKKFINIFEAGYNKIKCLENLEVDFIKIREHAKKNYILGKYKDSLVGLKFLADVNKDDFELMIYMGNIYTFYYKNTDKAIQCYLTAIKSMEKYGNLDKEISQLLYTIGCIYMYKFNLDKAIKYFNSALSLYRDCEYIYKLAQSYCLKGDKSACTRQIEKLIEENVFYSLELQFCFCFYPMKDDISFLLEEMSSKYIVQYILSIKKGNDSLKDVDMDYELEGAEDIKEELLKLKKSIEFDENNICFIYAYKNLNRAKSYKSVSEIYATMYYEGLTIKRRIDEGKLKFNSINISSIIEINNKISSLIEEKEACKIKIQYLLSLEKKFRICFSVAACCILFGIWWSYHFTPKLGVILVSIWIGLIMCVYLINVFGRRTYKIKLQYKKIEEELNSLQCVKAEEWESKRHLEKQIKKDISSMCLNYNNILNLCINEVNRSLGVDLGEVKINMI